MKLAKVNKTILGGNVASVDLIQNDNGTFGRLTIAVDNGYWKSGENGDNGHYVEKTDFVELKINSRIANKVKGIDKGDIFVVEGRTVVDTWNENQTGDKRTATRIEVIDVVEHIDSATAKQLRQSNKKNQSNQQQADQHQSDQYHPPVDNQNFGNYQHGGYQ
jgi:single-stranded DNA-binding protein